MNSLNRILFLGSLLIVGCGDNVDLGGHPPASASVGAQLALGDEHTCAVAQGLVFCWGGNRNGEVGDGTMLPRPTPVLVPGLEGVVAIASGAAFDLVSGTRGSHTCALSTDGTVRCWGPNVDGQKDEGTIESRRLLPTRVAGLTSIVQIAVGPWHSCAVHADGRVSCWGDNALGELGNALASSRSSTPVEVDLLHDAIEVAAGNQFTCALHADHTISCWGSNHAGQLGDGTTIDHAIPELIPDLHDVDQISTSWDSVCARLGDGTVRCWGSNAVGQLGDGSTVDRSTPVLVALSGVQQISAGGLSSCAGLGAEASCWGRDLSVSNDDTPPHAVMGLTGVAEIAASSLNHACARLTDGRIECWGENESGQLGDGTTIRRATPTLVVF